MAVGIGKYHAAKIVYLVLSIMYKVQSNICSDKAYEYCVVIDRGS